METPRMPQSPAEEGVATSQSAIATPDSEKLKRKRQPRNSACQGCAALKMKCISTPNGKCERCNRMDRDCVPAIPKPRKRRTESGVGMESEGSMSFDFPSAVTPTAPRFDPPQQQQVSERGILLSRPDLSHTDSKSFVSLFAQGLGASEDLLRGVDYNFVANSFTVFRQLTPYFPFVEPLPGADVISMVARRPAFTLAVCAVAAAQYPELQSRLSQAFQYALSSKVILGNERSMDLLTSLLVYLAWHHHYMSQQQIYQKLYLLAGIAADLGLYRPRLEPLDPGSALERDRAFVGSYYLCCGLSATGFDKPSPLRWTGNLRRCAENAAASGSLQTDRALVSMLELAHAVDDMEDGLRQEVDFVQSNLILYVDLQTRAASQRLKALKREHPSLGGSLGFAAATIHIYQRLLRVSDTPDYTVLIQCACAIKEYLDDLLARPPSTLHQLAIVDWTNLVEILVLMARVSRPLPNTGGWEAGALTSMLQPESVLDSIGSYMASAPPNDPVSPRHEPLLHWLRSMCDGIKKRILRDKGATTAGAGQELHPNQPGRFGQQPPTPSLNTFNLYGNGVLDPGFLNSLANGQ